MATLGVHPSANCPALARCHVSSASPFVPSSVAIFVTRVREDSAVFRAKEQHVPSRRRFRSSRDFLFFFFFCDQCRYLTLERTETQTFLSKTLRMPARSCEGVARSVSRHNLLAMRFSSIPLVLFVLFFYIRKICDFRSPLFLCDIVYGVLGSVLREPSRVLTLARP